MDTMSAFAMGQAHKDEEHKVFDWDKAATLIKENKPDEAAAGLAGDWGATGGTIYRDGKPVPEEESYTFLSSCWATPELDMDCLRQDCYRMQSEVPDWDSGTYWPESALAILNIP